jgi:hypothetical protein
MSKFFDLVWPLVALGCGLYYMIWPEKAEKLYRSNFDLEGPMKWYKPNTWQRAMPPVFVFRVVGVALLVLSLFLLYNLLRHPT